MLESLCYAVVVDVVGDVVSHILHVVEGVAHGYARAGAFYYGYVVAPVSESHRLLYAYAGSLRHSLQSAALVGKA